MEPHFQTELASIIARFSEREGINDTAIPCVSLFKSSAINAPLPSVYTPCLCIVAQGHKQVVLNQEIYRYGPSQFLAVSVNLPIMNQITQAGKDEPYLLLKIDFEFAILSDLLTYTQDSPNTPAKTDRGVFIGSVDEKMGDAILRLARLLDSPQEIPVLGTQTLREIFYRVLCGPYGHMVSQIVLKGSHVARVASAIRRIKERLYERVVVEELADSVGMSVSTFHAHFKAVTAMSPLQFQKTLRLIEARALMLSRDIDVANAAYQVGYRSSSQFSREYARMFGSPPGRDISILKEGSGGEK